MKTRNIVLALSAAISLGSLVTGMTNKEDDHSMNFDGVKELADLRANSVVAFQKDIKDEPIEIKIVKGQAKTKLENLKQARASLDKKDIKIEETVKEVKPAPSVGTDESSKVEAVSQVQEPVNPEEKDLPDNSQAVVTEEVIEEDKEDIKEEVKEEKLAQVQTETLAQESVSKEDNVSPAELANETQEVKDPAPALTGFTTSELNVRAESNTDSEIMGSVAAGAEIQGLNEDGWIKIEYNGMTGYVSEAFIEYKPELEEIVSVSMIEEETKPLVETQEIVEETLSNDEVANSTTETNEEVKEETDLNEITYSMQALLDDAYSIIGTPYIFGGSTTAGFDCSGFTSYLYQKHFGTWIGRVTTDQIGAGYDVGVESMQPGDLVLFQSEYSDVCDHVGIYVGGDTYIHAADESRGVTTDSTSGSYFQNNLIAVRRVTN